MYRNPNNWQSDLRQRFLSRGNPATYVIIGLAVLTWLIITITNSSLLFQLAFSPANWPMPYPWTPLTWPLVEVGNPLWVLFAGLWMFNCGGSLERSWGTQRFVSFFLATNVLTAITYFLGARLLNAGESAILWGLWMGAGPVTIAWCLLNRRETVCLGMVLPIPAIWLAYLTLAMVWYFAGPPILGLFALSGCAAAWWYVQRDRSGGFAGPRQQTFRLPNLTKMRRPESSKRDFSLAALRREREERKRLEDMFRRSGYDDKDNR